MKHRFLTGLAGFFLSLGLLALAITTTLHLVFGTADTLKSALKSSGVYDTAAREIARRTSDAAASAASDSQVSIDTKSVADVADKTFTSSVIEGNIMQVIDGTYRWLDGTANQPDFKIDLQPYVNKVIESVGDEALQHTQNLPACTIEQLRQLSVNNIDVLNLPCRPSGVDLTTVKSQAISQVTGSNDFLKNPVITVSSLPKDQQGKTAVDRLSAMPQYYQWASRAPWISLGLVLVCIIAILAATWGDWRLGARKIAHKFLGIGITIAILAGVARFAFSYFTKTGGLAEKLAGNDYSTVAIAFMKSLERAYDNKLLAFGASYAAIGLVIMLLAHFLKHSAKHPHPTATPNAPSTLTNEPHRVTETPSVTSQAPTAPTDTPDTLPSAPELPDQFGKR